MAAGRGRRGADHGDGHDRRTLLRCLPGAAVAPVPLSHDTGRAVVDHANARLGRRLSHKAVSESRGALAQRHARAAMRDDLATDDIRVTDEMAVFGAHP